jgi:alpha-ribazole phosphatase
MRHGESQYNVLGLCNADPANPVPLTLMGQTQARQAAERLKDEQIDCIYVSELHRAIQTAQILNNTHARPMLTDQRLNDRRSGFEGHPIQEYLSAMQSDPLNFRADGGESYMELVARTADFLNHIERQPLRCVLVVTHHEVLQAVNGHYRGLSPIEMWNTPIENAQILTFEIG